MNYKKLLHLWRKSVDNEKKKQSFYWTKGRSDYESEISKMAKHYDSLNKAKWGEPVWEQVAHEMAWVIGLLEDDPTSPKNWKKVFRVLRTYENLCRDSK
jgi:hypothetical protein